jgi:hypothetical protein
MTDKLLTVQSKGKEMQDDYSCQTLIPKSNEIDLKLDHIIDTEDENTHGASTEMKLRNIMSQGEVDILMTLFPKAAQTLAKVLRNRAHES